MKTKKTIFNSLRTNLAAQIKNQVLRAYEKDIKINVLKFLSHYAKRKDMPIGEIHVVLYLKEEELRALLCDKHGTKMLADSQIARLFMNDEFATHIILPKIRKCLYQLSESHDILLEQMRIILRIENCEPSIHLFNNGQFLKQIELKELIQLLRA
ncbi:MAG: hypothetical protein AAF849_07025 [Bacteroidota bacterium]